MMNMEGIIHHQYSYQLKPGTTTSYYLIGNESGLLPKRLCFTKQEFAPITCSRKQLTGQMKATFTKAESSVYKKGKGTIHTSIWTLIEPKASIIGTGDIQGTKDLLIFQSFNNWETIIIHLFIDGLFREKELINHVMKKPLTK
jgi:hypothetical protein